MNRSGTKYFSHCDYLRDLILQDKQVPLYVINEIFFAALFIGAPLATAQASAKPPCFPGLSDNTLHKFGSTNGLLSLHVTLPSSPVTSYSSPAQSSSGSPVTSPVGSPPFPLRSCAGNINRAFRPHGRAVTVYEWLRRLRLHKYSEVFKGNTFDEVRTNSVDKSE